MVGVYAEVTADLRGLRLVLKRATDFEPVLLGKVDQILTDFALDQFATEGGAGGEKWAPLRPDTIAFRRRPGHGRGGIGRDTNRMWSSVVKVPSADGGYKISKTRYTRYSNLKYMTYFSGGTRYQLARPIWPEQMPPRVMTAISLAIADYIATGQAE